MSIGQHSNLAEPFGAFVMSTNSGWQGKSPIQAVTAALELEFLPEGRGYSVDFIRQRIQAMRLNSNVAAYSVCDAGISCVLELQRHVAAVPLSGNLLSCRRQVAFPKINHDVVCRR